MIALLAVILLLYILPFFFPREAHPPVVELLPAAKPGAAAEGRVSQYEGVADDKATVEIDKPPVRLFHFDPNTITAEQWRQLGLRERTITTILNFIGKGGRFYQPADLKKIYGLRESEFERLRSYIQIPDDKRDSKYNAGQREDGARNPFKERGNAVVNAVDINAAGLEAFIALPGIGNTLAARIISFREKLGGFYAVEQVQETYGLPDSTFQKIRPLLVMGDSAVRKININTAGLEALKSHPYIRWQLASVIVQYRQQHGLFKSLDDIRKLVPVSAGVYQKILPYLEM